MKNIRVYLCALACVVTSSQVAYAANTPLEAGVTAYQAGKFSEACKQLSVAVRQQPNDAYSNYWYAISLLKIYQYGDALNEFALSRSLARGGAIAQLSQQAIDYLFPRRFQLIGSALQQLTEQSEDRQNQARVDSLTTVNSVAATTRAGTGALNREENRVVNYMENTFADKEGNTYPGYGSGDIEATKEAYKQRISNLTHSGQQDQDIAMTIGQVQSSGIAQTTDSLSAQLRGIVEPDGLQLNPVGTNMYVRNYTADKQSGERELQDELVAGQDRLVLNQPTKAKSAIASPAASVTEGGTITRSGVHLKGKLYPPSM